MSSTRHRSPSSKTLAEWVCDARQRTLALVADLKDEQLLGPRLSIVNPLLWEIGHIAWFQEKWVLRHASKQPPIRRDADALYDSAAVPHDVRWDLPLPARAETLRYLGNVCDHVLERIEARLAEDLSYFVQLSVFHEDMHGEAFLYARQTLAYPAPPFLSTLHASTLEGGALSGDVAIPGGTFLLGAAATESFVFDNEKWAHAVQVKP